MADYYKDEPTEYISFPKKTSTRYTALGQRQELNPDQKYTKSELESYGYTPSRRAIASVTVTETQPWETVFDRGDFYPEDEGTGQLRMMSHNPGKTEVGALVSDPSMRATVPTLLALATQGRQNITHDTQLSQHSSRLINKVKDKVDVAGPDKNPESQPNYSADKNIPWVGTYAEKDGKTYGTDLLHTDAKLEQVPHAEVQSAKNLVKNVLASRKLSPQFDAHMEQPQLPGTED